MGAAQQSSRAGDFVSLQLLPVGRTRVWVHFTLLREKQPGSWLGSIKPEFMSLSAVAHCWEAARACRCLSCFRPRGSCRAESELHVSARASSRRQMTDYTHKPALV